MYCDLCQEEIKQVVGTMEVKWVEQQPQFNATGQPTDAQLIEKTQVCCDKCTVTVKASINKLVYDKRKK